MKEGTSKAARVFYLEAERVRLSFPVPEIDIRPLRSAVLYLRLDWLLISGRLRRVKGLLNDTASGTQRLETL